MTERQMRKHLFRLWYRWEKLYDAMIDAQNAGLIDYPSGTPGGETCCSMHWKTREAIEKFTEKQIAKTVTVEIRSQV